MNQQLYNCVVTEKAHRAYRREAPPMAEEFAAGWLPAEERMVRRFERLCALQEPVFLPEERICLLRTTGRLPDVFTEEEALALVEEFFLSLNRDSDLYPGIQQGDDGQSLMLGGRDRVGEGGFNRLSFLCLEASRNLRLIDPKINVRVDRNTPEEIYTRCTELTAVGLGFPQYSNDDVVIPGLVRLGYAYEDAVEYTVAACWEFIIPGVGEDIPNIAALSLPGVVDTCLHRDLPF